MKRLAGRAAVLAFAAIAATAFAQSFPSKSLRLIVPY
jgi:tripartite-type tricarboxylate transporter receptor subunit TctC